MRENLDPELLADEAEDLFEAWWASNQTDGNWNEEIKSRTWEALWNEFGPAATQRSSSNSTITSPERG